MRRACLTLLLPMLLAGPAWAGSAARSEDGTASAAPGTDTGPCRGPLFTALAGVLREGGNGEGFTSGSDLGLALGYRFSPDWSLALDLSRQRGHSP